MQLYCYFITINLQWAPPKPQVSAGTFGFAYKSSRVFFCVWQCCPRNWQCWAEWPSLSCRHWTWMCFPSRRSSFLIRHRFLTSACIEETNMIIWGEVSLSSKVQFFFLSLLHSAFCGEVCILSCALCIRDPIYWVPTARTPGIWQIMHLISFNVIFIMTISHPTVIFSFMEEELHLCNLPKVTDKAGGKTRQRKDWILTQACLILMPMIPKLGGSQSVVLDQQHWHHLRPC